jgi:hypothetical protein
VNDSNVLRSGPSDNIVETSDTGDLTLCLLIVNYFLSVLKPSIIEIKQFAQTCPHKELNLRWVKGRPQAKIGEFQFL